MQQYLILFREADGRNTSHEPETLRQHRQDWNEWMEKMKTDNRLAGGNPLTLAGNRISGKERQVTTGPHVNDKEFVGGYLLINAADLEEATALTRTCPVFDFGGTAEVREIMNPAALPGQADPTPSSGQHHESLPDQFSGDGSSSLQQQNKEIVRRFNTAFIGQGDIAAFNEIVDPAVINHTAPPGMSKGADGMMQLIQLFRKALPDLSVEIADQVAEGDLVVTRKYFHATFTGEIMGISPSGRKISIPVIDIIRLRNGKYTEHWGIRDMSQLQQK